jgi:hypothetical protein
MMGQKMLSDQVAVSLSPQHFKNVVLSMNETLKAYERVFGTLTIPESDVAPANTADQLEKMMVEARETLAAQREARSETSRPSSSATQPPAKRSRGARKVKES